MRADNITVAVERAVHDSLRQIAEAIWDQHGICLKSVRFSWLEVSTTEKINMLVTEVEAQTLTKGG